jgi:SAM-dependent methyltransferase
MTFTDLPVELRLKPWQENWLTHRQFRTEIERAANTYARGRVLDVGCGDQPYRALFTRLGCRYDGSDHPGGYAEDHAWSFSSFRPSVYADALALPIRCGAYETVVSFQCLEHVADPFRAVSEMGRVLEPGGHLILTAPQMVQRHCAPHDYFRFTRDGLRVLAERAGLEVVEITSLGTFVGRCHQFVERRIRDAHPGGRYGTAALRLANTMVFAAMDRVIRPDPEEWEDCINHLLVARQSHGTGSQRTASMTT